MGYAITHVKTGQRRQTIQMSYQVSLPRQQKKINKWKLIKLTSFCTSKETINKMKRQPTEWKKIVANDATNKGFTSKIQKKQNKTHTTQRQKNEQPNRKMCRRPKQSFLQGRHTAGQQAHKRCSTSLIIREMQIKTTVRYHLLLVRVAIIHKLQITNAAEGVEPSCMAGGM